jgi:hypothetical protein
MAAFELTLYGRFWVTPKGNLPLFGSLVLSATGLNLESEVKNAWAIVLQVKEFFYKLREISTASGIA